jgi:hypothetical protein
MLCTSSGTPQVSGTLDRVLPCLADQDASGVSGADKGDRRGRDISQGRCIPRVKRREFPRWLGDVTVAAELSPRQPELNLYRTPARALLDRRRDLPGCRCVDL